jgi:anti-anti-sigma factor
VPDPLDIYLAREGEVTIVYVAGRLNSTSASGLDSHLRAVEAVGAMPVVVDLRELQGVDTNGFAVIHAAALRARDGGWSFALINLSTAAVRLLELGTAYSSIEILDNR